MCTYSGQGTRWLPEHAVNLPALRRLIRPTSAEITYAAGNVVVLYSAKRNKQVSLTQVKKALRGKWKRAVEDANIVVGQPSADLDAGD